MYSSIIAVCVYVRVCVCVNVGMYPLVSHSQITFSVLFVVAGKGSGYLTIDFMYCRIHKFCAALIPEKEVLN